MNKLRLLQLLYSLGINIGVIKMSGTQAKDRPKKPPVNKNGDDTKNK